MFWKSNQTDAHSVLVFMLLTLAAMEHHAVSEGLVIKAEVWTTCIGSLRENGKLGVECVTFTSLALYPIHCCTMPFMISAAFETRKETALNWGRTDLISFTHNLDLWPSFPCELWFLTYSHAKVAGQQSVGSKDRVETQMVRGDCIASVANAVGNSLHVMLTICLTVWHSLFIYLITAENGNDRQKMNALLNCHIIFDIPCCCHVGHSLEFPKETESEN